ncbi:MAG: hypothetical protein NZZ41_02165 [Candidatus Dojkabacteria bacterium]|nr:hypothetical protein [Candidatus Dojkabacteria bacterium]
MTMLAAAVVFLVVGFKHPLYHSMEIQNRAVIKIFENYHECVRFRDNRMNAVINRISDLSKNDQAYVTYFREHFYLNCEVKLQHINTEFILDRQQAVDHINNIHMNLYSKYRIYKNFRRNHPN